MVNKVRPIARAAESYGEDGRDYHKYIKYYCPTCNRPISGYKSDNACDECGTFYDWGDHEPQLRTQVSVVW